MYDSSNNQNFYRLQVALPRPSSGICVVNLNGSLTQMKWTDRPVRLWTDSGRMQMY